LDNKTNLNQNGVLAAKEDTSFLGCIARKSMELVLPLYLALVKLHLECCVSSCGLGNSGHGHSGESLAKSHGSGEGLGAPVMQGEAERAGVVQPGEEKVQGDLTNSSVASRMGGDCPPLLCSCETPPGALCQL